MNEIQNIETKVENGGTTPQGRVSAAEFNIITDAAKRFDVSKYGAARISEGGQLQFFADAASMASYEANPQTNAALLLKSLSLPTSNIDISGKLDKAEFYKYFEEVNIGTAEAPVYATRSKRGLFSDSFVSAMGLNPGMGGGGDDGGTTYSRLDLWGDYTAERAGWVLSAALGYELHNRVSSLESNIVPDLSEYATRTWVQQQGYATSAALAAHAGDAVIHISSAERTLWNKTAADFAAIVGEDSDDIINKWEEVVAFLDTYTEADTLANLLSNKVDKVAGYGLSKNDFTDALLSKLNGIAAGANRYVHPTGGADASIGDAAGRVLSGITVNAQGHVTSVSSKTLAAADIPTLAISKVSGLQDALDGKLDKEEFYRFFEEVNIGTAEAPVYATRSKRGLFSDSFLSAMGLNPGMGGGGDGGGTTYDRLDTWDEYTSERAGWVLSAALGYDLHSRVSSLEGGSALSFTTEGSGNVVTAVKKSGTSVTVTKGLTALTAHQPIYSLAFQAGAFEAKKYTPNTGVQTVNVPTKTSHLSNDSGFATKLGVSGNQIGTYVDGKLGNLITVPYATEVTYSAVLRDPEHYTLSNRRDTANVDFNADGGLHYFLATSYITDSSAEEGHILHCEWDNAAGQWLAQLLVPHSASRGVKRRYTTTGTWSDWIEMLDETTYNRYAPSLDGTGAIGSWDINAASATKLQTARTFWGQTFDGSGNVSGNMTDVGSVNASGEIVTTSSSAFRMVYGSYGTFFLQDGSSLYLMQTNANDQYGSFNNLRPLQVTLGTGDVSLCSTIYVKHSEGNVGIGISTPSYKLDVAGDIHSSEYIRADKAVLAPFLRGNTSNGAFVGDAVEGLGEGFTGLLLYSYGYTPIHMATNGYVRAIITAGGYFGIGTSSPAYKLDVAGDARLQNRLYFGDSAHYIEVDGDGYFHFSHGVYSDSFVSAKGVNTASDMRLKRRMADVELTVKDVAEAPVYRFAWINGGGIDVGSTAQYWEHKVPELTHKLPDGIHLGLDYGKTAVVGLVPVAKATLANTQDIADHERRIASLERENAALKRQLQIQNAI